MSILVLFDDPASILKGSSGLSISILVVSVTGGSESMTGVGLGSTTEVCGFVAVAEVARDLIRYLRMYGSADGVSSSGLNQLTLSDF